MPISSRSWKSSLVAAWLVGACHPTDTAVAPATSATVTADSAEPADLVAASGLPDPVATPLPGDDMGVTIHRLANGLTVYISTDRQKPRFSAWIAVRAGSRHDPSNSTGLAHYLEHMLFKGTDELGTLDMEQERPHLEAIASLYAKLRETDDPNRRADVFAAIDRETQASSRYAVPNEFDRIYAQLGVQGVNAFTGEDMTVYIGDVPANRLEAWARVESERLAEPAFRLFYPELEAVYEEKNLSLDNPDSRVYDQMMASLYPGHPYGTQTTLGHVEHLKTPAYGDMVEFFHRWYVPNNMAIVLAGDIDAQTALPVLERAFGAWEPKPLSPPEAADLAGPTGRVFHELRGDAEEIVTVSWRTVPVGHADEPALEVLDLLMDNAKTGLINLELEMTQIVPDAGSSSRTNREAGSWTMRATAREGQKLEEVETHLMGVLAKLRAGTFTQADIDAIVLHDRISDLRQLESQGGRVSKMAFSFINGMQWRDVLAQDAALAAVTRDDVVRVANTYLGDDRVVVYRRRGTHDFPKIPKPKITPVPIDPARKSPFYREIESMEAAPNEPRWLVEGEHYRRSTLPSGPLVTAHNTRNELFAITYEFDRGYREEPLLCHALDLLERSGAGERSPDELARDVYRLGITISTSCQAERSYIRVDGVDDKMVAGLDLLRSWLASPTFDDATVQKLAANTLSERRDQLVDPRYLGRYLDAYTRLGKRSPYLAMPTNARIRKASGKKLGQLIRGMLKLGHKTLYFGPRPAGEVGELLVLGDDHRAQTPPPPVRLRGSKRPIIFFLDQDVAKASIDTYLPRAPLPRAERPLADLYSAYLGGGMGGLVFQEIRESRGLAYGAGAYVALGRGPQDDAALAGYLATQVDKTPEALVTFVGLIQGRKIDPDRLLTAKTSEDESFRSTRVDPRYVVNLVSSWDDRGETADPRPWEWEQLRALGPDQIQTFATQFDGIPIIVGILGDEARCELDRLANDLKAQVVKVKPEELVSWGRF